MKKNTLGLFFLVGMTWLIMGITTQGEQIDEKLESEVISLVNRLREERNLPVLRHEEKLAHIAEIKAKDLVKKNYFSHTSPTFGSTFSLMKKKGLTYQYAGENLAEGQKTAEEVVQDWMNSPTHRANILFKEYEQIGVAYYQGRWVQLFKKP